MGKNSQADTRGLSFKKMNEKIAIAVINYNTKEHLKQCLESIIEQGEKADIYVVDNASIDGSQEMIKKEFPEIKLIENRKNLGYSRAANLVLKKIKEGYIFILNSDTKLESGCLLKLSNFMEKEDSVGSCGPKIINTDGTIQDSRRHFPSFIDATFHAFIGNLFPGNPFSRRYKMMDADHEKSYLVDWVSGAAIFIRAKAAQDIGYFDERYFMFVEDTDFCYRLWQKRWKVYYFPDAIVVHHIGKSTSQKPIKNIIEHQKSIWRFYLKHKKRLTERIILPIIWMGLVLRAFFLVCTKFIAVLLSRNKKI